MVKALHIPPVRFIIDVRSHLNKRAEGERVEERVAGPEKQPPVGTGVLLEDLHHTKRAGAGREGRGGGRENQHTLEGKAFLSSLDVCVTVSVGTRAETPPDADSSLSFRRQHCVSPTALAQQANKLSRFPPVAQTHLPQRI